METSATPWDSHFQQLRNRWFGFGGEAAAEVASWPKQTVRESAGGKPSQGIKAVGSVYDYLGKKG